ncbi:hypothetical protein LQ757_13955 [Agromyces sp. SYSU K20354]|uniref:hypothetical protein n=1 Tax=Agromyces cavernae TaxID=2898659 RepID=UPI001E3B9F42|nr:hypothetical protein [Agromyces cavernae]MCD2443382.1 hypothetical protein [Agromyces cavernae]
MRAVVLPGSGRYADPWHPFAETSASLAAIVAGAGYRVEVRDGLPTGLAALDWLSRVPAPTFGAP